MPPNSTVRTFPVLRPDSFSETNDRHSLSTQGAVTFSLAEVTTTRCAEVCRACSICFWKSVLPIRASDVSLRKGRNPLAARNSKTARACAWSSLLWEMKASNIGANPGRERDGLPLTLGSRRGGSRDHGLERDD